MTRLLVDLYPNTAAQYDRASPQKIALSQISPGSNKAVQWRCPVAPDHTWSQRVFERTSWGDLAICPFCANRKLSSTNSLASCFPLLAKEFDLDANSPLTPDTLIAARSTRRYYWRCPRGHLYQTRLSHRLDGHGCPNSTCHSALPSKPQTALYQLLSASMPESVLMNEIVSAPTSSDALKKWEVDILIPDLSIAIEYDGYYHLTRTARDLRKNSDLSRAGYRVIRIREYPLTSLGPDDILIKRDDVSTAHTSLLAWIKSLPPLPKSSSTNGKSCFI